MSATIGKQFSFHAAHRLPNHDGLCKDLHGHTYTLEVLVTGLVKQPKLEPEPDEGMVMDFKQLKDIYKSSIEPQVEHKFLNETLKDVLPETSNGEPLTTCENLALWIFGVFTSQLTATYQPSALNKPSVCIRLWETPTSFAEVGKAPWRG